MFSGLGWVRREQPRAQVPPGTARPQDQEKELKLHNGDLWQGQDEVYVSLQSHMSLSWSPSIPCKLSWGTCCSPVSGSCSLVALTGPWGGKALMFRDFLQRRSSAEPNGQFEISPWQSFRHLRFFFPFSLGERSSVSRRWTQRAVPVAGAKLLCYSQASLFQLFAQLL